MKKFVLLCSISIIYITGFCQTLQVDWGDLNELSKNNFNERIIGSDKDGFLVLRSSSESYKLDENSLWLDYYNSTMKTKESSNQLLLPTVDGMMAGFLDIFYLNSKIILLTTVKNNAKKMKYAYIQLINSDGTLNNKPVLAGEMSLANKDDENFTVTLSADKTRIMVSSMASFEKYAGQPLKIRVFDTNLKDVVNKDFELPLKDRTFSIVQYAYGNSGNIYLNVKAEQAAKKKTSSGPAKYENIILVHNATKSDFDTYNIAIEKNVPADMIFNLDNEENLIVVGFVTPKSSPAFTGVFYQKINPRTAKIEINTSGVFSRELIAEFANARLGDSPSQYYDYTPKNILFLENGSAVFIAEHSFTSTRTMVDPKTKAEEVIYYYNYNDLLAACISKTGTVDWTLRIPKNQRSINDNAYFLSYRAVATRYGNKVKILLNDTPSNLSTTSAADVKEMKRPVKGIATLITLYSDGSIDKAKMFDAVDMKYLFAPTMFLEAPGQFIIQGTDGKSTKFGAFFFD